MNRLSPLFFVPLSVGCGASGGNFPADPADGYQFMGPNCTHDAALLVAPDALAPHGFEPAQVIASAQGLLVNVELVPYTDTEMPGDVAPLVSSMEMTFSAPTWGQVYQSPTNAYFVSDVVDTPSAEAYARNALCPRGLYIPVSWTSTSASGLAVSEPSVGALYQSLSGEVSLLHAVGYLDAPTPEMNDIAHNRQPADEGPWAIQAMRFGLGARLHYQATETFDEPSTTLDGRLIASVWTHLMGDSGRIHRWTWTHSGEAVSQ